MLPPRPTQLAHTLLRQAIHEGDTVIDATAGNGHDTVFLAGCVGPRGRVLAFDIQAAAIESARAKVAAAGFAGTVEFHHLSHGRMGEFAPAASVAAVMFNLGYLPGAGHELVTHSDETLAALDAAAALLRPGGALAVVCYPGHPGGDREADAVTDWFTGQAGHGWRVTRYGALGTLKPAPFLLLAAAPTR